MQYNPSELFEANSELAPLQLAVIIPVLNERDNIVELIQRLSFTLAGIEWEALFIDDGSKDGSRELIADIARTDRRIRLIYRLGRRGLSTAVLEGMLATAAPVLAVMDADLQHDESILPDLYRPVASGTADLAIGTRYSDGGSTGHWSRHRVAISAFATRLAETVMKVRVSDPMSGYFVISRDKLLELAPQVSGVGYKILLDLIASSKEPLRIAERPYTFRLRNAGESKLDAANALQYLELLAEKKIGRWVPIRFMKFALVGTMGVGVHMALLWAALAATLPFRWSQSLAVFGAMTFNYLLNNRFTYRDRRQRGMAMLVGLLSFYLVCGIGAVANVGVGATLFAKQHDWWLAGLAGAAVGSIWNYAMGSIFTWRKPR